MPMIAISLEKLKKSKLFTYQNLHELIINNLTANNHMHCVIKCLTDHFTEGSIQTNSFLYFLHFLFGFHD